MKYDNFWSNWLRKHDAKCEQQIEPPPSLTVLAYIRIVFIRKKTIMAMSLRRWNCDNSHCEDEQRLLLASIRHAVL